MIKKQQDRRAQDRRAEDPRWDKKQGTPKDSEMTRKVEHASSRYSASEQSEQRLRRKGTSGKS